MMHMHCGRRLEGRYKKKIGNDAGLKRIMDKKNLTIISGLIAAFTLISLLYTMFVEPVYDDWYKNHIKRTLTKYHHRMTERYDVSKESKVPVHPLLLLDWDGLEEELLDK